MPRLMIVVGSTRPGRVGLPVAQWFEQRARARGSFEVELVDLKELALPFVDEPNHPSLRKYTQPHTLRWSEMVQAADAFVFVTPEYNHGYPAPLKNAIDFLVHEWAYKPLGLVSYGGVSGGTRSQQQLKQIAALLKLYCTGGSVIIPFIGNEMEDGKLKPSELRDNAADGMLYELALLASTLAPLRG